ncbi:MAG: hypothetical protein LIO75_00225 [Lachnospiraceae bacterium]|nr:hypothetical protein [Lachnospiraceae bacterium]
MADYNNCTHNCNTCAAACDADGERKPGFFDRLEAVSEHFEKMGEDGIIDMLNEAVATLEAEEDEAAVPEGKSGGTN